MLRFMMIALFIVHGLITAAQSGGSFTGSTGVTNPGWMQWWPTNLGQSWLLTRLGLESRPVLALIGLLWLAAGVGFLAAGLGVAGWMVPQESWRPLAAGSALISVALLALLFHPLYLLGVALNAGVYLVISRG